MRKQTKIWKCKDGRKIRICDMDDRHLINTIKMLERLTLRKYSELILAGDQMLCILTGGQAIAEVESQLDNLYGEDSDPTEFFPIFENLTNEAIRRNLNWGE